MKGGSCSAGQSQRLSSMQFNGIITEHSLMAWEAVYPAFSNKKRTGWSSLVKIQENSKTVHISNLVINTPNLFDFLSVEDIIQCVSPPIYSQTSCLSTVNKGTYSSITFFYKQRKVIKIKMKVDLCIECLGIICYPDTQGKKNTRVLPFNIWMFL